MPNIALLKSHQEGRDTAAAAGIKPGHLLATVAGGVQNAGAAAANPERLFANINTALGKGLEDAYAAGDEVETWEAKPGDRINIVLANGQNVTRGTLLESAAGGEFQAVTTGAPVVMALEDIDASGGATRGTAKVV